MITILRAAGGSPNKLPAATKHPAPGTVLRWDTGADPFAPWAAARGLLSILRQRFGDSEVDAAIAPHRATLSLVLYGLVKSLNPEELHLRHSQSGLLLGFLPNTTLDPRPLAFGAMS